MLTMLRAKLCNPLRRQLYLEKRLEAHAHSLKESAHIITTIRIAWKPLYVIRCTTYIEKSIHEVRIVLTDYFAICIHLNLLKPIIEQLVQKSNTDSWLVKLFKY